jgi:3-oxoacyl-[acyl-carrier protein] reductase
MLPIDLKSKVALVTGASGNLGEVIAQTLARCGADVVVHYHKNEAAAETVRTLVVAEGVRCLKVQADITDWNSVIKMRDSISQNLAAPDIVVNNAVIQYQPWQEILDEDPAVYEGQFRASVMQGVYLAKAFVPAMIQKKNGRIIAINSESSLQCQPGQSGYVSGKRGMDGVMRVLAREIGSHQITVNQVAPGAIAEEAERKRFFKSKDGYAEGLPLKRRGTAQETANMVAFLASDLASFVTGAYIPVCGGNVMVGI